MILPARHLKECEGTLGESIGHRFCAPGWQEQKRYLGMVCRDALLATVAGGVKLTPPVKRARIDVRKQMVGRGHVSKSGYLALQHLVCR